MTAAIQHRRGGGAIERPSSSSLADVVEMILDKGLVIDAYVRVSLVGIELLTIDARIVIASVDTYLRFAEATNRLDLYQHGGKDLSELAGSITESGGGIGSSGSTTTGGDLGGVSGSSSGGGGMTTDNSSSAGGGAGGVYFLGGGGAGTFLLVIVAFWLLGFILISASRMASRRREGGRAINKE